MGLLAAQVEMRALSCGEKQRVQMERSMRIEAEVQNERFKKSFKRMETRVAAGVCPHCNRTFKQLAAHMKCKHSA